MQDPTIHYAAAIEAVRNAHERYNIAVQVLADRRDRRKAWLNQHLTQEQEAVRMTAFKVGDKVTHPLTGDTVLTVLHSGIGRTQVFDPATERTLTDYSSEFTPYPVPRVSTSDLMQRVDDARRRWGEANFGDIPAVQALIDAATAYRDRLEEESR